MKKPAVYDQEMAAVAQAALNIKLDDKKITPPPAVADRGQATPTRGPRRITYGESGIVRDRISTRGPRRIAYGGGEIHR